MEQNQINPTPSFNPNPFEFIISHPRSQRSRDVRRHGVTTPPSHAGGGGGGGDGDSGGVGSQGRRQNSQRGRHPSSNVCVNLFTENDDNDNNQSHRNNDANHRRIAANEVICALNFIHPWFKVSE